MQITKSYQLQNLSFVFQRAFLFLFLAVIGRNAFAQAGTPICHTDSINVSTGINTATSAILPNGSADPGWKVVARSTALNTAVPALPSVPTPAWVVAPVGSWIVSSSSKWISFYDPNGSWYSTTAAGGPYNFTLEREFEVCSSATLTISSVMYARDNYISNFRVISKPSNTVLYTIAPNDPSTSAVAANFNAFTTVAGASMGVFAPGKYAIEVTVHNFPETNVNPHAFQMQAIISSSTNALLAPGYLNCDCETYNCDDKCYWRVEGNNINMGTAGLRNIFGTLTNDDIRVVTNGTSLVNTYRGVIRGGSATTGGYFGWNTMFPTARWHVNCANGNTTAGTSDIRFEGLESGTGSQLAIDANGYVYNSGVPVGGGGGTSWSVNGNNITGNNIFGTLSPNDVDIYTSGIQRGILTSGTTGGPFDDGRLGWQTINPTAHLHIQCRNGNPDDGSQGSDVRFEELEPGSGHVLVIDDQGYVYDSKLVINADGTIGKKSSEQQTEIELLKSELAAMKAKLDALANCCTTNSDVIKPVIGGSILYQNTPNPFSRETAIEFYISGRKHNAYILVSDLTGKELSRYPITSEGKGSVIVNSENLSGGVYMYSLVVDGREVDSKRMVFTR